MSRHLYVPGVRDTRLPSGRWRGRILNLATGPRHELVAYVYGETVEKMRERKHAMVRALQQEKGHEEG